MLTFLYNPLDCGWKPYQCTRSKPVMESKCQISTQEKPWPLYLGIERRPLLLWSESAIHQGSGVYITDDLSWTENTPSLYQMLKLTCTSHHPFCSCSTGELLRVPACKIIGSIKPSFRDSYISSAELSISPVTPFALREKVPVHQGCSTSSLTRYLSTRLSGCWSLDAVYYLLIGHPSPPSCPWTIDHGPW